MYSNLNSLLIARQLEDRIAEAASRPIAAEASRARSAEPQLSLARRWLAWRFRLALINQR